jgi:hypothetical protein
MKITRNTMRADGLTVGESIDRDAAFLRSIGIPAKDGGLPYDEALEEFTDRCRQVVLDALDTLADEMTANRENGWKDGELPKLFAGVDPIAQRIFNKSQGL